ncbi:MAG TPA: branched-chain amino acid ABC transporter permease [Chloroflexota bacterium]
MSLTLQLVITGLAVGAMYGLVALGFVIIYNVTGVVNFAQGTFPMLGGLIMVSFAKAHVPVLPAIAIAALLVGLIGVGFGVLAVLTFGRGDSPLPPIIVTLGLSLAFEGIAMFVWSFNPLSYQGFSGSSALYFLGAAVYPQALWVMGVALILVLLAYGFFEHTFLGKAVRACAMGRRAAMLIGIDVQLMALLAFGLSAATGAIVGAVITPLTTMSFNSDVNLAVNGFAAAIFGGLENPMAAVAGGLVLGVAGTLAQGYIGNGFDVVAALVLMLIVLVSRPQGVFATMFKARVRTT